MIRSFPFSEHPNVGTAIIELSNYLVFVAMVADYAHVSSACIGVCDSYFDEKQINYGCYL